MVDGGARRVARRLTVCGLLLRAWRFHNLGRGPQGTRSSSGGSALHTSSEQPLKLAPRVADRPHGRGPAAARPGPGASDGVFDEYSSRRSAPPVGRKSTFHVESMQYLMAVRRRVPTTLHRVTDRADEVRQVKQRCDARRRRKPETGPASDLALRRQLALAPASSWPPSRHHQRPRTCLRHESLLYRNAHAPPRAQSKGLSLLFQSSILTLHASQ